MELSDEEMERLSPAGDNCHSDQDRGIGSDEAEGESSARDKEKVHDGQDEEESKRRVDPSTSKKRIIKNPQPKLNMERIQGSKGVQTIEKYFEGFKYHGRGHEKNDLNRVMKRLEHWAHRLFPKYRFDDFIEKIELLGTKKNVQVFLKKYRLDMITNDRDIVDGTIQDDAERDRQAMERYPVDEFDKLIAEQIEKQRVDEETVRVAVTPKGNVLGSAGDKRSMEFSDEIKARIESNKKLALERKIARSRRLEEEEKKKKASEEETPSVSPTIGVQSQMPQFLFKETMEEREKEKNKRQKFENSPKLGQVQFADSDANLEKETNVEKYNDTENTAISENLRSNQFHESEELLEETDPQNFQHVQETMEISTNIIETEETAIRKEEMSLPQSQTESSAATANGSERLLTHQELLMAIDGAMEEIIGRKN